VPTRANTQPAFGCYFIDPDAPAATPAGVLVLTLSDDRISTITRFLDKDLSRVFGHADAVE
jgi:RNA polymerase sigma-70 factor (ECF subfamily)